MASVAVRMIDSAIETVLEPDVYLDSAKLA